MNRKICVVTGALTEYGLLRWVMEGVRQASYLATELGTKVLIE
jgi:GDP/UDP-N,N'-diacetylbacillosamine 2-epimerase (hydrolysing)